MSSIDQVNNRQTFGTLTLAPLQRSSYAGCTNIREKWEVFHENNPHVYDLLREMAINLKKQGFKRCGIGLLWERLRWLSYIETYGEDEYRLRDSHRAFYARLLMEQEPELEGFFMLRYQPSEDQF